MDTPPIKLILDIGMERVTRFYQNVIFRSRCFYCNKSNQNEDDFEISFILLVRVCG